MTEATVKKLEEAFAIGATDEEACFYADISKVTLYAYQDKHPEFTDRKEALKERPILLARQTVVKAIETDSNLAMKYLERKRKVEFALRSETDITSLGEKVAQPLDANLLTQFLMNVENNTKR